MFRFQYLYSFIAGALTVLAFAPFDFIFIPYLTLAFLFYQWLEASRRKAALSGYFFGLGLMSVGVFWLHVSIAKFGGVPLLLAMLLALVFAACMASFYALAGWLVASFMQRYRPGTSLLLLMVFPAMLVLTEILKAFLLTGFPWLSMGYSQIDVPIVHFAPLLGVFGVSWIMLLLAGMLLLLFTGSGMQRLLSIGLALLVVAISLLLGNVHWSTVDGDSQSVRIVQGNVPQELKWQPANLLPTIDLYASLSFEKPADLIVWPETAIPAFAHRVEDAVLTPLQDRLLKAGTNLVLGIPVMAEDRGYFNSMLSLGVERDQYDKRHLVPFGEFAPLSFLLRPLVDFFQIPMSDFREGTAKRPLLKVGNNLAGVSICYEDAFGNESVQSLPDAAYLINVSNDAWFGDSLAPYQHLQIARMRAVESSRYLLRATNTGISAVIDHQGKLLKTSGQGETAVIEAQFQPMTGTTLYAVVKDWLILFLMLSQLGLVVLVSGKWRH